MGFKKRKYFRQLKVNFSLFFKKEKLILSFKIVYRTEGQFQVIF